MGEVCWNKNLSSANVVKFDRSYLFNFFFQITIYCSCFVSCECDSLAFIGVFVACAEYCRLFARIMCTSLMLYVYVGTHTGKFGAFFAMNFFYMYVYSGIGR